MSATTNPSSSFYWYDYETFGTHPALDRPAQFAGLRTDLDLNPVGDPLLVYCQLNEDYLPSPEASQVTGITPQTVAQQGIPEYQFIKQIKDQLSVHGTCNTGYNNIRFDDEFTRNILYRNFFDAYEHEWKNNNSRWDLLDIVRLARALRPDGMQWPIYPDGRPSNRLEDLTKANGLSHESAHDALSDVHATIAVARMIKENQPRLFQFVFEHRKKASYNTLLDLRASEPLIHVSGMYPGERSHLAIVAPISRHPDNSNGVIVFDLLHDPAELADLATRGEQGIEEMARRLFTKTDELAAHETRLPLKTVHVNRAPVLVPLATLRPQDEERLGIDKTLHLRHFEELKAQPSMAAAIGEAMQKGSFQPVLDSDAMLYSGGFFSSADRAKFERIQTTPANKLADFTGLFDDQRANEMLFRYRARNFPTSLTPLETENWQRRCADVLVDPEVGSPLTLDDYFSSLKNIEWKDTSIRDSLQNYGEQLRNRYL